MFVGSLRPILRDERIRQSAARCSRGRLRPDPAVAPEMKRLLFYILALAFIGLVTAATSLPAGQWKMLPTFAGAGVAVLAEWAFFWRPLEREERHQARQARGLCRECGYDLTANTSGTCPECGTTIANPNRKTSTDSAA
jgi:uncharacterized paraquat-inducible protein A